LFNPAEEVTKVLLKNTQTEL